MVSTKIFKASKEIQPSKRGEYEITDAIKWLLQNGYDIGYENYQKMEDVGEPNDVIEENIDKLSNIEDHIEEKLLTQYFR